MTKKKKLKVFHGLVNYGTQAGVFANELRNQGFHAFSVSFPDRFKRQIDVELLHGGVFFIKIFKHTWNWARRIVWFFRYNVFHFYYGTNLLPAWIGLWPYKIFRKKLVVHYLGFDVLNCQKVVERYNLGPENRLSKITPVHAQLVAKRLEYENKYADLKLVCAPCYSEFAANSIVLPLGINLDKFRFIPATERHKIVIMHAPTDQSNKGTDHIIDAVSRLIQEGFPVELDLAEGLTHDDLIGRYINCNIFIDQITYGWYGTAAIEAMALGRPTLCFIDNLYFQYIDYGNKLPIVNVEKETVYEVLKDLINNRNTLRELGKKSRQFVEEVHDARIITKKLIQYYKALSQ